MTTKATNVVWHDQAVTKAQRAEQKNQKPCILWFTGLSGSGKSTVANALDGVFFQGGHHTYVLDGDNVRHGLNKDLGFSDAERVENIRRIGEVAKLFADSGLIVSTAFISPFREDRELVRSLIPEGEFLEVYVEADLSVCEARDPKGLYKKARAGEIPFFTGIDSPYEAPESPEITVNTGNHSVEECVEQILAALRERGVIA